MALRRQPNAVGYGQSTPLPKLAPRPLVADRAPTVNDNAPLGTSWLDQTAQAVYQLVKVDNTGAIWVTAPAAGATVVTSLQVTGAGGIDVDQGDIDVTLGDVNIAAGNLTVSAGTTTVEDLVINGDFDISSANAFSIISTADVADAILLRSNGGTNGQVHIDNNQGTGTDSIFLESDVGGITLTSTGLANASALDFNANAGGITLDAALGISIDAAGAASNFSVAGAGFDLSLESAGGRVVVDGGEAAADAVRIVASNAAGGIDIDAGTAGLAADSTGAISLDAAAASNFSVSGAGIDLTLASAAGRVVINGEEAAADAIRLLSAAGGIDANAALQVNIASSQNAADAVVVEATAGGIDILASGAAAGEDIDIIATGSSVNIESTEAVASAITLNASDAAGGIIVSAGSNGFGVTSTAGNSTIATATSGNVVLNAADNVDIDGADITADATAGISLDAATASNLTCAAGDLTLAATAGSAIVSGGEAVIDAVQLSAANGGIRASSGALGATTGINLVQGAANASIQVGSGAPSHSAPQGSLYLRTDGTTTNDRAYINTDGATTWTAIITAA